jgi:hypothetical protein
MVIYIKTNPLNYDYMSGKELSDVKYETDNEIFSEEMRDNESDSLENDIFNNKDDIKIVTEENEDGRELYVKIDDKFISYKKIFDLSKTVL